MPHITENPVYAVADGQTIIYASIDGSEAWRKPFVPFDLFANGEQGVWYDPSDLSTLFQDHLGTIPADYGQPVGLMLDKSKGGPGPELRTSISPTFPSAVEAGAYNPATGEAVLGRVDVTAYAYLTLPSTTGRRYRFSVTNTGDAAMQIRSPASTTLATIEPGQSVDLALEANVSNIRLMPRDNNTTVRFTINSIREIPGNHASQPTVTARPTLGRVPRGGRRNLITRSEDIVPPGWVMGQHNTTPVEVLPGIMGVQIEGLPQFAVYDRTNAAWIIPATAWPISSGRFSATFTAPPGCVEANMYLSRGTPQIYSSAGYSVVVPGETYTISMHVNDGRVGGAQYERGSVMTPYQRVGASAFDVTEAGVETLHYLDFDGVDDFLVTSTITPGTDKVDAFAGLRKLGIATVGIAMELGVNLNTENGGFYFSAPLSPGGTNYSFATKGTSASNALTQHVYPPPSSNVLSGYGDIAGDVARLRVDGQTITQLSLDQGDGNYLPGSLYIGSRRGSLFFYQGHIYGLGVRFGGGLQPAVIEDMEAFLAAKTGVAL